MSNLKIQKLVDAPRTRGEAILREPLCNLDCYLFTYYTMCLKQKQSVQAEIQTETCSFDLDRIYWNC